MRRFLLFGGDDYYACGGFYDFIGSYDAMQSAVDIAKELEDADEICWWHIYDKDKNRLASQGEGRAYGTSSREPLGDIIDRDI